MKNLLLAFAFLFAFGLTSCTKDYTCTCTITDSSGTIDPVTTTVDLMDYKKGDAEDACSGSETTVGTLSTTCELN